MILDEERLNNSVDSLAFVWKPFAEKAVDEAINNWLDAWVLCDDGNHGSEELRIVHMMYIRFTHTKDEGRSQTCTNARGIPVYCATCETLTLSWNDNAAEDIIEQLTNNSWEHSDEAYLAIAERLRMEPDDDLKDQPFDYLSQWLEKWLKHQREYCFEKYGVWEIEEEQQKETVEENDEEESDEEDTDEDE